MRTLAIIVILSVILPASLRAQQKSEPLDLKKHKIVMQFSDADSVSQARVALQVENVKTSWPNAEVEVVCLGGGLDLLMKSNSKASKAVADLSAKGVVFAACNNTMRMRNVKKEDLLSQAVVVPAAVVELASKQEEGWSYFRAGK